MGTYFLFSDGEEQSGVATARRNESYLPFSNPEFISSSALFRCSKRHINARSCGKRFAVRADNGEIPSRGRRV
jgi:hypothetical protein